jgi:tripartite-type tricarboxylate transporter receptor subunit TctC
MNKHTPMLRRTLCAAALSLAASLACAWTDKPVKLVVPAPAGGAMDMMARLLSEQLQKDLGQTFVVDNRPGAGGGIGVLALLNAPADGQTIMITGSNVLTEIPHVMKPAFDPLKDVRPVQAVARVGNILVTSPALPAQDFAGLVTYLKAAPGKHSFASHSPGTVSQYAGLQLSNWGALDLQHIPFAGAPPALQQVMGGQVTMLFDGLVTALPLVKGGKLRAYALGGPARNPGLPDVPTFTELGRPELDYATWFGVIVSSKMPDAVVERISLAVQKAASAAAVRDKLVQFGFEIAPPASATQLQQSVRADYERYAAIVKKYNITP